MARRRQFNFDTTKSMLQQQFSQQDAIKNIVLRELLQRQTMEEDDVRSSTQAEAARRFQREQGFLSNPDTAVNALRAGMEDARPYVPPVTSRTGDVRKLFAGKGDLKDLPSREVVEGAAGEVFGAERPDIEALLAERDAEEKRLAPFVPSTRVDVTDPTGAKSARFIPQNELSGQTIQTEPDAITQGQLAGAEEKGKILGSELDPQIMRGRTQQAASMAGAQTRARMDVEYDPKYLAAEIDKAQKLADIDIAKQGQLNNAKGVVEASDNARAANMALYQIKELYDRVKIPGTSLASGTRAAGRRLGEATGVLPMVNPQASQLNDLARGYAMLIYRGYGGTGANVSDRDLQMMLGAIPFAHTLAEIGDEVFANSSMLIKFMPMIKARYGTQPFEQQMEVANQWRSLYQKAQQAQATQFEDPFTPGAFVPVDRR